MKANYPECLRRVLLSEGGYTNDPRDPGGPTNWGITLEDAQLHWKKDATADDVKGMPRSVAETIYKDKYWDALGCDDLPSGLDYTVFDYGVNSGIGRAARILSQLKTDNVVKTVDAINDERLAYLKALVHDGKSMWEHFGRGWGARVASVKAFSEHLALDPPSTAPAAHYSLDPDAKTPKEQVIVDYKPVEEKKYRSWFPSFSIERA